MRALLVQNLIFNWPGSENSTLRIPNLSLAQGERVFLFGPSGSGKSTLLSAIGGVVDVSPGAILVADKDVGAVNGGARDRFRVDHIGMIFQVFNLVPWLSALENVLLPCTFSQRRRARAGDDPAGTARRLLDELGLSDPALASKQAHELSVGQQQRVAAARALIGKPDLILADEPTSALDEAAKAAFVDLLARECAEAGAALLFVSHDRSLERHFDRGVDFLTLNRSAA
ncbi:ABC transporter ATP-binding protein [Defluviimonas sp. WL0024]|uniref:ABC transporter ATP-binding protein n=1 Tax=Albidovulum salinarum TaxID=2984153 RepID=A0ABT2X0B9_9RHOB|nr:MULTISPECIES: ABC transporter ATP-binding protein [Rhodobacterales]MCU9846744.1 ABC transporter ATP-binding protein [Defluviimonas sp. WL0024]RYH06921.1 ABC transporter ATP-binding protein [Tropicimonas sp. IMCC6043]